MASPTRHYGLDWLRIGAFAILILYHVGMVFVPWGFHAKLPGAWWVAVPMMASNPWRLSLLFVVSGYASRALLARAPAPGAFAVQRTWRLLTPLAFGVVVVVPPQPWVELTTQHGYAHGLVHFYLHDYFRFGLLDGVVLPAWNHLWFVAYLWAYTLALALLIAAVPARGRAGVQWVFASVMRGPALLLLPLGWLAAVNFLLFPGQSETHALWNDGVAHATYFPALLFGFALAGAPATLAGFAERWGWSAGIAVIAYALVAGIEIRWPGSRMPAPWGDVFAIARAVEAWAAIAALIGAATRFANRDHPWRATLTEAVFPFYIIHQTIIVVVAWWLMPRGWPAWANASALVAATVAGCWTFYLVGRRIVPLRPLIGLRRHVAAAGRVDPRPAVA